MAYHLYRTLKIITMDNKRTIFNWVTSALLAFGMLSGGIAQLMRFEPNKEGMLRLGYPLYFMSIIGTWKILGVVIIMLPKLKLLKEWTYAGFFFLLSGATLSHLISKDPVTELIAPFVLLCLTIISWSLRPDNRKLTFN